MSIATTISSVVHAVLVMVKPGVWEAIFGTAVPFFMLYALPNPQLTVHPPSSFSGGVEAAVSITVCNSTVIIPAVLRALGAGDPFMREDTVDPRFSTGFDIAPTASTTIELSIPTSSGTRTTDSTKSEGAMAGTLVFRQQHSMDLDTKSDDKCRLTTRASDGSPMKLRPTNLVLQIDDSDITDSSCSPSEWKGQDIEASAGGWHAKGDNT